MIPGPRKFHMLQVWKKKKKKKKQHLSGDSGDEGSVKSSEKGSYLPKITQLEEQREPKAYDLFTSVSYHLLGI